MKSRWSILVLAMFCSMLAQASSDSICAHNLRYEKIDNSSSVDSFLWIAGDKKYNAYYKGTEFILERKHKPELWRVNCLNYSPYPGSDFFIDTIYFKDISESGQRELFVVYSLFTIKGASSTKSHHLLVIDIPDRKVLLNIATYDYKIAPDENGRVIEYMYDADVEFSHNMIRVRSADDSEIDNPAIQLADGVYHRRGHCFVHVVKR